MRQHRATNWSFLLKLTRWTLIYSYLLILLTNCGKGPESTDGKHVFRYNCHEVLGSLDPAFASDQATIWATTQLYNGLIELDSNLRVQPSLAESWVISEDLKTYTFNIRGGVHFHDHELFEGGKGRILNAYDVEYSLKRICDTTDIYNKGIWIFKDKVLKDQFGRISDTCFKAVDDQTFKVYLEQPSPHFLQILAMPYAFVIPHEVAEHYGREFRSHPVGTGPFKFSLWEEGNTLIFLKNEAYWKSNSKGERLPYLDAVQVSFTPDKGQAFRSFMLGSLDMVSGIEFSFIDDVLYMDGAFKENIESKFNCTKIPYLNTEYIGIQLDPEAPCYKGKDHPLLNVDFRKALTYAIDKNRLVATLRNGVGNPGNHGMVPPAVPDFELNKINTYQFDPAKAISSFEQSGWKGRALPEIYLTIAKENKDMGEFLSKQWEEVLSISIKVQIKEPKAIRGLANKGQLNFFKGSWLGDYPDAENYLALFYSNNFTPNGPNKTHFKDDTFDSLYLGAAFEEDHELRYRQFETMDKLVMESAPVIVLFYDEVVLLSQKNVSGLASNPMNVLKLEATRKK